MKLIASLLIALILILTFVGFNIAQQEAKKQNAKTEVSKVPGNPTRLVIPSLNIDAHVQHVGVDARGEMEVPSNITDVGWFKIGSLPGMKGSAVIAGHFDGINKENGVFVHLNRLKKGDKLYTIDEAGSLTHFMVQETRMYDPGYADEVFAQNDTSRLNLVTCDGVWEEGKKSYNKRLVVFTTKIE